MVNEIIFTDKLRLKDCLLLCYLFKSKDSSNIVQMVSI